jgi:hypothetical protein
MGHLHGLRQETGSDQGQDSLAVFLGPEALPKPPALNDDGEGQDRSPRRGTITRPPLARKAKKF